MFCSGAKTRLERSIVGSKAEAEAGLEGLEERKTYIDTDTGRLYCDMAKAQALKLKLELQRRRAQNM